ncbi:efflux RND transporter periplasmic adaptor subunit [Patescibacteria group bacterium]|nr:efflux RND transporter periplasmic adaptor subunit [Patescibacteria group bacterium]
MRQITKHRWFFIMAVLIIAAFGGYFFLLAPRLTPKKSFYTVKRENLSETLSFSGSIKAAESANLHFQTSGQLIWVGVKPGDTVKKYQVLASLDQRGVQDDLKKYLNAYMSQRWDFETAKDNYNSQLTSDLKKILDKAQFDLNSTVADVEIKNLAVEYSNLWTPIDGIVVSDPVPTAGTNITSTGTEFDIVNPRTLYFSASADQADVVRLAANQSGEIILDAYPDKTITSGITAISFTPETGETGTVYEVKMTLPVTNSDYSYRLGMTGNADFIVREAQNVIAVPTKYIKSNDDGSKYVWIMANGKRIKQNIETGDTFDTDTEVKSGLTEGIQVTD